MQEINSTIDKQLEDYLNGELSGKALKAVEKMIQDNPTIAEEVRFRKSFRLVVENRDGIQFNQAVREVIDTTTIEPDLSINWSNTQLWWQYLGISIGVVLLGALVWWGTTTFLEHPQQQAIHTILTEHLQPFENKLNDNSNDNLANGLADYDAQNYGDASQYLQQYINAIPMDTVPQFYLGLSYLMNHQPKKAIPYLQNTINGGDGFMIPHGQWYLGLAYLEIKDVEKAKGYFKVLENNSVYGEKVSAIFIKLKE